MKILSFLFFLFFSFLLFGSIVELENFDDLEKEFSDLGKESFILFDVDSTLLIPKDTILKPCAKELSAKLSSKILKNPSFNKNGYSLELLRSRIKSMMKYILLDENSPLFIKTLQKRKIKTLAFTGADSGKFGEIQSLADLRVKELQELGFDFSRAFPNLLKISFSNSQEDKPLYKSGVIFSAGHSKGKTLKEFLEKIKWKPKIVVLVDNKFANLLTSQNQLEQMGIEFRGFHYTKAKKMTCPIDSNLANFQFSYLASHGKWLSDEEAKKLLEKQLSK